MDILEFFKEDISHLLKEGADRIGHNFAFWKPRTGSVGPHVCLVAHVDTVYPCTKEVPAVSIVNKMTVLSRKTGLGADDRAGVYAALTLRERTGCSVLLTDKEETGGIGAWEASATLRDYFKENVNFFIEMDRRGDNDMVFYNNEPGKFVNFIGNFGFKKAPGSYSDISTLGKRTEVAGVNISTGYYREHTLNEILVVDLLEYNIDRVQRIIEAKNNKKYKIGPVPWNYWSNRTNRFGTDNTHNLRTFSGKKEKEKEKEDDTGYYYGKYEDPYDVNDCYYDRESRAMIHHGMY